MRGRSSLNSGPEHRLQHWLEVSKVRSLEPDHFGPIVPAAQSHRGIEVRLLFEGVDLLGCHQAALQCQAANGSRRKRCEVAGLRGAEVTLGDDMQADWFSDIRAEAASEEAFAEGLVTVVNAVAGAVLTVAVEHV